MGKALTGQRTPKGCAAPIGSALTQLNDKLEESLIK